MRKKKELTEDMLVDWWLTKYYNTTLAEVFKKHPNWTSKEFYPAFQVTQEQHDEWYNWMLEELQKYFKCSKKCIKSHSWGIYLDTSPMVKREKL